MKRAAAGDEFIALTATGLQRRYVLHVPGPSTSMRPLVLMLHGAGGSAAWARDESQLNETADRHGFIAAYPEGLAVDPDQPSAFLKNPQVWNAGAGPGLIVNRGPDDVAFLDAVLDDLMGRANVDPQRVYVTGFSNGAAMTFRFAAERGQRLRAIAPLAGYCPHVQSAVRAVPTLYMVGADDPLVPVGGGDVVSPWDGRIDQRPPLADSLARWATAMGLPPTPRLASDDDGLRIEEFGDIDGQFRSVTIAKLGHHWPGGLGRLKRSLAGKPSQAVSANEWIWDFFRTAPGP